MAPPEDGHRGSSNSSRSLMAATFAASCYGGWAYFVNHGVTAPAPLVPAVVQGLYSFALTLGLSWLVAGLRSRLGDTARGRAAALSLTSAWLFVVAYLVQWSVGTVHVTLTILPGWLIGSVYAALWARLLTGAGRRPCDGDVATAACPPSSAVRTAHWRRRRRHS